MPVIRPAVALAVLVALLAPVVMPAIGRAQPLASPGGAVTRAAVPVPSAVAWTIDDEAWDRPRSADAIRTLPAVRAAVAALAGTPRASLVIRHGAGQNDALRAEELRHWLVALAIEPGRIALSPATTAVIEGLPRGSMVLELAR